MNKSLDIARRNINFKLEEIRDPRSQSLDIGVGGGVGVGDTVKGKK